MSVKEIDVHDLKLRLDSDRPPLLLDIRSDAELAQGVIPGAEYLPMHLLPLRHQDIDGDREVVIYCRSGARSYSACGYLLQQGLDNCVNLRGGILAWAGNGFPVDVGAAPMPLNGLG